MLAMHRVVIGRLKGRICIVMLPFMVGEAVWCVSNSSVQTVDG